jgi:NTE family protein
MRALVLSGGGSKGPFHVGFCKHMIGELKTHYDILCGISVGGLVASFLAQYKRGQEELAAQELTDQFLPIRNENVWKSWFLFGKLAGLWKSSFLNSSPLESLIFTRLDINRIRASRKKLRIGAVSLTQGTYHIFDETYPDLPAAVLASAIYPGFLSPTYINNEWWVDGGIQQVTPIKAAIDAGATEIDVVVTAPSSPTFGFEHDPETVDVILRALDLMTHRLTWVDIQYAQRINELVRAGALPSKREVKIRVAAPLQELNRDPLHFDPKEAREIASLGYHAAIALDN